MPVQKHLPLTHANRYSADSACGHCEGVIRHESWCITQSVSVQYAYQVISDPDGLSLGDDLILHALGVAWTPRESLTQIAVAAKQSDNITALQ